jgi:DNA adenine methylase
MVGPLCYIGGKSRLAAQIIKLFPQHHLYCEPFFGGGQVFFRRRSPVPVEIVNDLDGDLVNFYRCCQNHYQELVRYLQFVLVSREWYSILKTTRVETLTDIQRAARRFVLQRLSYAGLVVKQNYKAHYAHAPNYNPAQVPEIIKKTHERLQRVQIECLPYQQIIGKVDRDDALFYIDSPYFGRDYLYKFPFGLKDFAELAERLASLRGKFVASLNDVPEVRSLFKAFDIRTVEVAYSALRQPGRRFRELIIKNF